MPNPRRLDWLPDARRRLGILTTVGIPGDLQPILDRPRIVGDAWLDRVPHFGHWWLLGVCYSP